MLRLLTMQRVISEFATFLHNSYDEWPLAAAYLFT
jgi:hypothetical protein